MAERHYRRRDLRPAAAPRRKRRPLGRIALTAGVVLLIAVVACVPIIGGRLWFSGSGEVEPVEACASADCRVQSYVAVDGRPLLEPLSFVARADSATEIDVVFRGFPVPPEELRIVLPQDRSWLVAEGTLQHPEAWPTAAGEGAMWVSAWDRAGNGSGVVRRTWRRDPQAPWAHVLATPPSLQLPAGGYALGSDALITISAGTPSGNYPVAIEVKGSEGGRTVTARARLVVSVLEQTSELAPLEGLAPSGRRLYASLCSGCHGATPNQGLRSALAASGIFIPTDGSHAELVLEEEERSQLVSYLASAAVPPRGQPALIPHGPQAEPCLACHGAGSMAPIPDGHALGASACTSCHAQGPIEMAGPLIPHGSNLGKACQDCHALAGRLPLSDTHRNRGGETCLICHSFSGASVPAIPHPTLNEWGCLACHDDGASVPMPDAHRRTADWICLACHEPATASP